MASLFSQNNTKCSSFVCDKAAIYNEIRSNPHQPLVFTATSDRPLAFIVDIPVEDHFFAEALDLTGDPVLLDMIGKLLIYQPPACLTDPLTFLYCLDMIDPPKLMDVLQKIIGDDVVCVGVQPRTVSFITEEWLIFLLKNPCLCIKLTVLNRRILIFIQN